MTRPARKLDPVTEAMASSAYRIQVLAEGLDEVANAMERKWGVGRLRLIVSDFLRAKFDEQKDRLDAALQSGEERFIAAQVDGMRRAWSALDRSAHDAGEKPLAPDVWECVLPSTGEIVSLVRTEAEAHHRVAARARVLVAVFDGVTMADLTAGFSATAGGAALADVFSEPSAAARGLRAVFFGSAATCCPVSVACNTAVGSTVSTDWIASASREAAAEFHRRQHLALSHQPEMGAVAGSTAALR